MAGPGHRDPGGCRLTVHTELSPRGMLRLAAPLLSGAMRRNWARDLLAIKAIAGQRAQTAGTGR